MTEKCDYCNRKDAEIWIEFGSYGLGDPSGCCLDEKCIEDAHCDMMNYAEREKKP